MGGIVRSAVARSFPALFYRRIGISFFERNRRLEMKVNWSGWKWVSCSVLLVGGCGTIPEFIVDAAWSSAKETIAQSVHDGVADLLDFDNPLLPFGGEFDVNDLLDSEDARPPFDEVGDDEEEPDGEESFFEEDGQDHGRGAG